MQIQRKHDNAKYLLKMICILFYVLLSTSALGSCLFAFEESKHKVSHSQTGSNQNNSIESKDEFSNLIQPFLASHCIKCHGTDNPEGDTGLLKIDGEFSSDENLEKWELIMDVLEDGEMPPEAEPQPNKLERQKVVAWIKSKLVSKSNEADETPVPLARRLTNFEYENSMRDLLGFKLKLIDQLPRDPIKPYRFNNTADLMRLGPEQIERYLECARRAMASAIVDPEKPTIHKTRREWKPLGVDRGLAMDEIGVYGNRRGAPGGGMQLKSFPKTGDFRIRIKASAILPKGVSEMPLRLVLGYGGLGENQSTFQIEPVGTVRLSNNPDNAEVYEFTGRIENHPIRPPKAHRGRTIPASMTITPQNLYDDGTLNDDLDFSRTRNISMPRAVVEWIEFESPLTEVWPPQHHKQILFDSPLRQSDINAYVREVIQRFMNRAYRRVATATEVDRFVAVYELVSPELKTFEASIRETLAMVLVSPQFLFHTVANNETTPLEYELASKLSYFLWGSMPDEKLFQLAANKQLNNPAEIKRQVQRLLADPRSEDFVRNFTMQWLSLEKMKTVPINQELFPRFLYYVPRGERAGTEVPYRPTIRDYMIEETVGFVAELLKTNQSALKIVDSDFVYINQPLAAHYGIEGVSGIHFSRVSVEPKHHLGGLLTHGSILIGNGTGTAPHPIYRAVWLREAILGDEVAPPPAEVPALSDSAGESAEDALTIKDLLVQHRQDENCNSCHARLDPWGIPFEKYNAIGKFQPRVPKAGTRVSGFNSSRHTDRKGYEAYLQSINKTSVDASSRLPRGPEADGLLDLKKHLLTRRKKAISENVLRRLMTYGIGRELNYRDRPTIEAILENNKQDDYRLQNLVVQACQSEIFRGVELVSPAKTLPKKEKQDE